MKIGANIVFIATEMVKTTKSLSKLNVPLIIEKASSIPIYFIMPVMPFENIIIAASIPIPNTPNHYTGKYSESFPVIDSRRNAKS